MCVRRDARDDPPPPLSRFLKFIFMSINIQFGSLFKCNRLIRNAFVQRVFPDSHAAVLKLQIQLIGRKGFINYC